MSWLLTAIVLALTISVAKADEPIRLPKGPHLFADDYLIAKTKNLTRTTHQPEKLGKPVIPTAEAWHEWPLFFVTVIHYPEEKLFRMWYNVRNNGAGVPGTCYAYAESKDGLIWERPKLGFIEAAGTKDNNLFMITRAFGLGLVDDGPDAPDPSRRYKMAYYEFGDKEGMHISFSADGLRFTDYEKNPVRTDLSDIIDACHDPIRNRYIASFKVHSTPEDGYKGSTPNAGEGYRRLVGESVSTDFIHWRQPWRIVVADPKEPGVWEFYGMVPRMRGDLYLGFLRVLRDDLPATPDGPVWGIGWTELVTSRDGEHWTRHREPFLDRDTAPGTWDHAMAWVGDCITVGNKEYIYYGGYAEGHKHGLRQIGIAFLRKNGFVSRDAGDKTGDLRTPLLLPNADSMTVNAEVKGELRVRVLDEAGNPVRGFDWQDCDPIRGDSVRHPVRWRGCLSSLWRKPVRLEFRMRRAELYGFGFD